MYPTKQIYMTLPSRTPERFLDPEIQTCPACCGFHFMHDVCIMKSKFGG
jgi:hypothetical protein